MSKTFLIEKYIRVAVRKALKEQEQIQKKSEASMYMIYRFPGLKTVLEDIMSPSFGRYIKDVDIISPKPTTFKFTLINSQSFFIYYLGKKEFMAKIAGKKYYTDSLGDLERASAAVTSLLELNYSQEELKDTDPVEDTKDMEDAVSSPDTGASEEEETKDEE